MKSPSSDKEDKRIEPIRQHIAARKTVCDYGISSLEAGKIQFSVAQEDLSVDALIKEVDQFYRNRMQALIVLAPNGFNAKEGEVERVTKLAEEMNKAIWMAFARIATRELSGWTVAHYEQLWMEAWRDSQTIEIAVLPRDNDTSFNIQAMGPWYKNKNHFRYGPSDLFLLLVSMKTIKRLQGAKEEQSTIHSIREKAFDSTAGLVDFLKLVVPETLEELPEPQRMLVIAQRSIDTNAKLAE